MTTFWVVTYWCAAAVLLYVFVGYLGLLFVATFLVRRRQHGPVEPMVSLVIPAHNEEQVIQRKLENALALDYPSEKLEVLVASDGSTDRTTDLARKFVQKGVRVLEFTPRRGKASVLNDAVSHASGEVVCLCDANVMFERGALQILAGRLGDPTVGAVTGDVRIASHESNFGHGESTYYGFERRLQLAESTVGSLIGVDGGMYVVRKALYQPLPPDTILDDFVISMRVIRQGYRVVYEPKAVAHENGTPAAKQEWRRRVRVSAGAAQSLKRGEWPPFRRPVELWQYFSHKLLRWMIPWILLLLFVSNIMLATAGTVYCVTLLGQTVVYLAGGLATVSIRFRQTRIGGVSFYFVMSNLAMAVGLIKGLFNRQPVTWVQADRIQGGKQLESLSSP